jgi:hypothetical protein
VGEKDKGAPFAKVRRLGGIAGQSRAYRGVPRTEAKDGLRVALSAVAPCPLLFLLLLSGRFGLVLELLSQGVKDVFGNA